jgi:ATP-dependent protease ClpP protease subunit
MKTMRHRMQAAGGGRQAGQRFWSFRAAAEAGAAELLLYGPISDTTWWGDEVTPALFAEDLAALGDVRQLTVRIYSYGGDPFAALAIRSLLNDHPAEITVRIDGAAASAATLIAPARARVVMPANSALLVHHARAAGFVWMTAEELRQYADEVEAMSEAIVNVYAERTGMERDALWALMDEDRWMYAAEAVEKGFADELLAEKMAARVDGPQLLVNGVGLELARFDGLDVEAIAEEAEGEGEGEGESLTPPPPLPGVEGESEGENTANALFPFAIIGGTEIMVGETRYTVTASWFAEHFPALADEIRGQGVEAERERQLRLDAYVTPATAEIIAAARASGASPGEVCEQIVQAGLKNQAGLQFLQQRAADAHVSGANGVAASVAPDGNAADAEYQSVLAAAKRNCETGRV